MKTGKRMQKWGAALLAVLLMISLLTLSVAADDAQGGKKLKTGEWIEIGIGAAIVIVLVVLGIKYRAKVAKFFREYKSEIKRIVWLPWDQTKKSTLVVLIAMVICATVICLLDLGLGQGILALIKLIKNSLS